MQVYIRTGQGRLSSDRIASVIDRMRPLLRSQQYGEAIKQVGSPVCSSRAYAYRDGLGSGRPASSLILQSGLVACWLLCTRLWTALGHGRPSDEQDCDFLPMCHAHARPGSWMGLCQAESLHDDHIWAASTQRVHAEPTHTVLLQGVVDLGIALTRQAQGKGEIHHHQDFTPYVVLAFFGGIGSLLVWCDSLSNTLLLDHSVNKIHVKLQAIKIKLLAGRIAGRVSSHPGALYVRCMQHRLYSCRADPTAAASLMHHDHSMWQYMEPRPALPQICSSALSPALRLAHVPGKSWKRCSDGGSLDAPPHHHYSTSLTMSIVTRISHAVERCLFWFQQLSTAAVPRKSWKKRSDEGRVRSLLQRLQAEQATARQQRRYPAASCPICFEDLQQPGPVSSADFVAVERLDEVPHIWNEADCCTANIVRDVC